MNNDRELLELAAKAARVKWDPFQEMWYEADREYPSWNPLTDDGDALRLAVKLKLNIELEYSPTYHYAKSDEYEALSGLNGCCTKGEDCNNNPYAATRRAIVRAAAEIGRSMK